MRRPGVLTFTQGVQGGCLCFDGTRIPVDIILTYIGDDPANDAEVLRGYSALEQADLDAARWFDSKWQVRRRRTPKP